MPIQVLLVGITGDRGLCGGYNTYAIKKIETRAFERIREIGPLKGLERFLGK